MHKRILAAVKAAALSCGCAVFSAACSGGSGTTIPSQPPLTSSSSGTTSSSDAPPLSNATGVPSSSTAAVPVSSPPGTALISPTSLRLEAARVPAVPSGGTQVFTDSFESDAIGQATPVWSTASGTWSVCQQASSTHQYCATSGDGGEVLAGNASWADYYVDATAVESNFNQGGVALLGRVQDASHFYQLELRRDVAGSSRPMWYIWRYDGRTWTEIAGGAFSTQSNPDYRLRLAFSGSVISAFVAYNDTSNFQALGSGTDTSYTSGKVGLRSWATNAARFDNVAVTLNRAAHAGPAPMPTSAPAAPSGGVATYHGCPVFTAGDWYNNDVSHAPAASNSASQISATNSHSRGNHFVFSVGIERLNLATNSTPTHAVGIPPGAGNYHHASEFAGVPWPWQNGYYIEGTVQSGGGGGSDNHALTLNTDTCTLYETYWTYWSGSTFGAYSGGHWNLSQPFVGFKPSAMASGLSLFAGAIKWEYDLANGSINHALNFYVPQNAQGTGISLPAVSSGSSGTSGIDYGAHLRLHANFPETGNSQMIAVIRALKKYGMFLADTSGPSSQSGFYTITPLDGNNGHYSLGGDAAFTLSDFDVIPPSTK